MSKRIGAALIVAVVAVLVGTTSRVAANGGGISFFQGFERNTSGWCNDRTAPCDGLAYGTINREPSGYSNYGLYAPFIKSADGNYHARISGAANGEPPNPDQCTGFGGGPASSNPCYGPYTDWGVGSTDAVFPTHGFITSVDIYLDTAWAGRHSDVRFDWDTALNDNNGNFLQDYVFNAGTSPTPGDNAFYVNASTNAFRSGAFPENPCPNPPPCRTPVHITASGWYSFVHHFFNSSGQLEVEMLIINDSNHSTVADWSITPGHAINTVGGPAYGWFPNEEIYGLPIDDSVAFSIDRHGDQ